jgi:hypothetical protein
MLYAAIPKMVQAWQYPTIHQACPHELHSNLSCHLQAIPEIMQKMTRSIKKDDTP